MKRLIIMRHAKSSWSDGSLDDHDRPLNDRGKRDAPRIASHLAEIDWVPEIVLSSDSRRTRETFDLMSENLGEVEVVFSNQLYLAAASEILEVLATSAGDSAVAMTLSHNPGCEQLVSYLAGQSLSMTTANAALFEVSSDSWTAAISQPGNWKLHEVVRPKEID